MAFLTSLDIKQHNYYILPEQNSGSFIGAQCLLILYFC